MATHSFKQVTGGKTKYKRDNGGYSTIIEADVTSEGNIVTVTGKNDNIYINLVVDIVETITADGTVTTYSPRDITGDALGDILNVLFNTEGSGSNAYIADYGGYGDYSGVPAVTGIGTYMGIITDVNTPVAVYDVFYNGEIASGCKIVAELSGGSTFDYMSQSVLVYSGIWGLVAEVAMINNNVVTWNNRQYAVKDYTAFDGTEPNVNTAAYIILPVSQTTGYIKILTP